MYICLCKGITEEKLAGMAQQFGKKQALEKLNIGSNCGPCYYNALEKLDHISKCANKSQTPRSLSKPPQD